MPSKGQPFLIDYMAFDTANQVFKTGDVANHTLRLLRDGAESAPTNAAGEVDATNAPGAYTLSLTLAETNCNHFKLVGKSSTSGIIILPETLTFETLPTSAAGTTGGLLQVGGTNPATTFANLVVTGSTGFLDTLKVGTSLTIGGDLDVAGSFNLTGKLVLINGGSLNTCTGTIAAVTNLTNAPPDSSGVTTLLGRLTSARGGYLDNLNVGGAVASHADIAAINQSASKHLLLQTSGQFEAGEAYVIEMRTYAALDGSAVDADSTPTLTATGQVSGSLAANLSAVTHVSTGLYRWTYTVGATPTLEQMRFDGSATIATSVFTLSCYSQTVDEPTALFTSTDKSNLTAIFNKLPSNNIADETLVLAAVGSPMQAGTAVALAASQPNYAPSKAGDAMTLTSGERTTLAGVIWGVLTSAITTVGSIGVWLKSLANYNGGAADSNAAATLAAAQAASTQSTAAATVLANLTTGTGTDTAFTVQAGINFSGGSVSLNPQEFRDALARDLTPGTAIGTSSIDGALQYIAITAGSAASNTQELPGAWVDENASAPQFKTYTLANGGGGGGDTINFTAPAVATVDSGEVNGDDTTVYRGETAVKPFVVVDGAGAAVDLTGKTIRFTACRERSLDDPIIAHDNATDGGLAINGTASNVAMVTLGGADTATVQDLNYSLWDITSNKLLSQALLHIADAAQKEAEKEFTMNGTLTQNGQLTPKQVFGGPVNVALRGSFGSGTVTLGACDTPSTTNTDYITVGIATGATLTLLTAVPSGWFVSGFLANSTSPSLGYQIG